MAHKLNSKTVEADVAFGALMNSIRVSFTQGCKLVSDFIASYGMEELVELMEDLNEQDAAILKAHMPKLETETTKKAKKPMDKLIATLVKYIIGYCAKHAVKMDDVIVALGYSVTK